MTKIALIVSLSVSALALTAAPSFADYTLNILHINDLHSRIEPINKFDSTCSQEEAAEGACFGGVARVAAKINERREALKSAGENVIVLDAGDQFQGSLFYTTYKGKDAVEFMNRIGFDAMAVGNHEFDDGPAVLAAFIDEAQFPVLSGNTRVDPAETVLHGKIEEWTILDLGGEKVGILSVLATDTDITSAPGPNVTFVDEIDYLKDAVARLEAEGINKIILLSHVGLPRDQEIAAAVDGIDVIVGGHSHTLLSNTVEGAPPYPTNVKNPSGKDVPIVQAYAYSKYVGELRVVFDGDGNVVSATGDTILLDNSVTPDPEIEARVKELAAPIEELKLRVIAETTAPIDGSRETCRARECEMGNLVADAMLDRVRSQGIQIAIQNGGGLRASIDAGEVTMGEILTVLPFQNTLATFQLSGADIEASLEAGLSQIEEGKGRFPQVAGLRYTFDPSVAPNEGRLQSVEVMENGRWVPLDPEKIYGVVTNNFMRGGGDGYELFKTKGMNAYDYGPGLEQVVADYLAANSPYTPRLDGRIKQVSAATAAAEPTADASAQKESAETAASASADTAPATPDLPAGSMKLASEPPAAAEPASTEAATEQPQQTATAEETPATPELPAASMKLASEPPAVTETAPAQTATDEPADEAASAQESVAVSSEQTAEAERTHVVRRGDTYWHLAREYYGDPRLWTKLKEANPDMPENRLAIGATLTVPPADR
jgi:5'-nucleotidase